MHTCVELDMYGIARDAFFLRSLNQSIEQAEGVYFRLQIIVEHRLEGTHLGVHDHDVARDAIATEHGTLVSDSHGEIVDTMVLQCLGHLHTTGTVGVCLDHAHEFGLGLHKRAVVVEVLHHSTKVHFQHGLMHFLYKQLCDLVEAEATRALEQDDLVAQALEDLAMNKGADTLEEELLRDLYFVGILTDNLTDTDELHHAALAGQVADLVIEFSWLLPALEDVAEDERTTAAFMVGTAIHEVKRDVERVDIRVVRVVDQCTAVAAFLHLQTHGNRLQLLHTFGKLLCGYAHMQGHSGADDGVGDRRIVDERNGIAVFLTTLIYIMNRGRSVFLLDLLDIHRCLAVLQRPAQALALVVELACHLINNSIILVVHDGLCIVEKDEFLTALLLHRREVLLMSITKIRQHGNRRLDDVTQRQHLTGLTDTRLEDTHLGVVVHEPHREGHTDLRVIATRTASHIELG